MSWMVKSRRNRLPGDWAGLGWLAFLCDSLYTYTDSFFCLFHAGRCAWFSDSWVVYSWGKWTFGEVNLDCCCMYIIYGQQTKEAILYFSRERPRQQMRKQAYLQKY